MGQSRHKQEKACGWNFYIKNGVCFQIFLEQLASEYLEYLNVVQLDNGRFHYISSLKIPDNILLIFQPPYSPELNLGESVALYKTRIELGNVGGFRCY